MNPDALPWAGLKLLLLDVDGVLTDGRIVMDDSGQESKFFHVRDGHGLKLLMRAGIEVGLLTGRHSQVVAHRAADLGISLVHQGSKNKIVDYEEILATRGLVDGQVAFAGDDLVDLPVLRRVALALAPQDAIAEVKAVARFVSQYPGGHGAVREMVEFILKGLNLWDQVTSRYF